MEGGNAIHSKLGVCKDESRLVGSCLNAAQTEAKNMANKIDDLTDSPVEARQDQDALDETYQVPLRWLEALRVSHDHEPIP